VRPFCPFHVRFLPFFPRMRGFLSLLAFRRVSAESGADGFCEGEEVTLLQGRQHLNAVTPTFYLAPPGAAVCVGGESVSSALCDLAVHNLAAAAGETPARSMVSGSGNGCLDGGWGQVPTGCSAQSGGDWAAHFKTGAVQSYGCVHQAYQLVCTTPQQWYLAPPGAASCVGGSSVEANACGSAVQALAAEGGETPGRDMVSGSGGGCLDGGWGQVPGGCSAQSGGDWAAHFKTGAPQVNGCVHTAYQLVCTTPQEPTIPPVQWYLAPPGAASCVGGSSVEANACGSAVQALAAEGGETPGRDMVSGSGGGCLDGGWGQVPGGCSAQSGGDWAAHFKTGAPQVNGCVHTAYQLVCTTPQVPEPVDEPFESEDYYYYVY